MNKTLLNNLRVLLLVAATGFATSVHADSGSADEATWLTHLKTGAVANHWVGHSVDATEDSFSLTDSDMHRLLSAFGSGKSQTAAPKYDTKGLRYMTELGTKQIQIQVMYAF